MTGLDRSELEAQPAQALPAREQLSLLGSGSTLGAGLVDTGSGDPSAGLLGGTDAAGGSTPDASTADSYTGGAQQAVPADSVPTENDGSYDPDQTASSTTD